MRKVRLTLTREEFDGLVRYFGFACEVTPDALKAYLVSLKPHPAPVFREPESECAFLTGELMQAETSAAALTMRCHEAETKVAQMERARGAIMEENALLKQELERLRRENEQLRYAGHHNRRGTEDTEF